MEEQPVKRIYTAEDFNKAYKELVDEMGFYFSVMPIYVQQTDGRWATDIRLTIVEKSSK